MKKWKKIPVYWKTVIVLAGFIIVLNILGRIKGFCDWYVKYIFPVWLNTYGRFSGMFKFSFGEKLIDIAIIAVVILLVILILRIILKKKPKFKAFTKHYCKTMLMICVVVILIMTLNCSLLYNCHYLDPNKQEPKRKYTCQELLIVRNYVVEKCNSLAEEMDRDEDGNIVYSGNINEKCKEAIKKLNKTYPNLSGYYPDAKPISGSKFMSQTYTSGIYFPFSLEANYNNVMYILNYPSVICHEYSHLKGYIYEDEANFISYLACIGSDDLFIQYSGYAGIFYYIDDSYFNNVSREEYNMQPSLDEIVDEDLRFLDKNMWDEIEKEALIDTGTVSDLSNELTDASLKSFGVSDGIASYDRVTELLLEYYDKKLY